jgi:CIC family chloride channel protein
VDPLEATFVREVMEAEIYTISPERSIPDLYSTLAEGTPARRQRLYPVVDATGRFLGIVPWSHVLAERSNPQCTAAGTMMPPVAVAYPDEILRSIADRMASLELGVLPVVDRSDPTTLLGLISQFDLLRARQKLLEEERTAERILTLRRVRGPLREDGTDGPASEVQLDGVATVAVSLPPGETDMP